MLLRPVLSVLALLAIVGGSTVAQAMPAVDFDREIRPILSNHCFQCHGPDEQDRKAGLRLDRRDDALAVIVPGDVPGSELLRRIRHADADVVMPPPATGKPLGAAEKLLLERWVESGAQWAEHWSFVPPVQPELPEVRDTAWPLRPLDRFVLGRLEGEGLTPNGQADRRALLRRVTLDLTGLPPTADELRAFLADESKDAYGRVVDRLLTSSAFGEHMARFWLDASRYGDTHGLHLDNYREMWPFRDWVVRAFNDNLPYDRFVTEQLAGDLLPEPTLDQRIASGFNRCHISTNEGGSIKEEVYVRNVIDRVSTTGTVFLGLTLGCAVCHDHKFDPISKREVYQLFAFFNNLDGDAMDGNNKAPAPVMKVQTQAQRDELARLVEERQAVDARFADRLAVFDYEDPAAAETAGGDLGESVDGATRRREIVWIEDALPAGTEDGATGFTWVDDPALVHRGARAIRRRTDGVQQEFFRRADTKLRVAAGDVLFAWVRIDPDDAPTELMLQWNSDGRDGWLHGAYWGENAIPYGQDGTSQRVRMGDVPAAGEWVRLEIPAAQVGLQPGMAVHGIAFTQKGGTSYWDAIGIESSAPQVSEDWVWIDDEAPAGANLQGNGRIWQWRTGGAEGLPAPVSGTRLLRRAGRGLNQDFFTGAMAPLRTQHGDRLFAYAWLDPKDPPRSVQLQFHVNGRWEHRVRWGVPAHGAGRKNGADFVAGKLPPTGEWVRLEVGLAEVGIRPGDAIAGWAFTKVDGTVCWDRAGVHTFGPPDDSHRRSLRVWEPIGRGSADVPADVRAALAVEATARTTRQRRVIRDHWLRHVWIGSRETFAELHRAVDAIAARREAIQRETPTTLVMVERMEPRPAFDLMRGAYDQKGDPVERRTPAALPPMAPDLPRDRLGLARWLVDPGHPLTARVAVNRFWQQVFGTGLVRTSEDFGNQGERPSHPRLLDWLAVQFVASGWDVKALMRELVTSATYRQSARVRPEVLARDPDNRLLARGPRFRLDGETLRDQALMLGGLLVRTVGGAPVKPPQPAGLWRAVGYSSSNTAKFVADEGRDKVHRRSLYTFWKRTAPPPQFTTFGAPSREECRVRRERTDTPMQALLLMNDPQFVECARAFAERILRRELASDTARIEWALERATCRVPVAVDVKEVHALLARQRAEFSRHVDAARRLINVGAEPPSGEFPPAELAAWTMVANLILNLDTVLTNG
ncbi:MAG: PSD1 and planctomycete cytochrome C domain-containing protein [bacterium]|nr:PSD1 and planctomycete cytochrome C domain-containing protein [bacterium]